MIAAHDLRVELGGSAVIDGVTLAFTPGWTAVVGPNGAGKSTLLRALAGLLPATQGSVRLDGRPLHAMPARERGRTIAWLAQQSEAGGDLAVRDVVRLGRLPHTGLLGTPGAADEAAVDAAMAETECGAFAARRLSALSGGERQRVLLARALAVQAPVLLLDEPTTHLDAPHQRLLLAGLRRRAAAGATVVSVLHDVTTALAADRVVVLHGGHVAADGAPGDAALQRTLVRVFDGAFSIEHLPDAAGGGERWVALPRL
ncbi:MAG: ABC transporter ATP-binding protein [Rubrivivax sp.]|nr:ABC transporter ATP-binding protein [Rubrivivax sp.]